MPDLSLEQRLEQGEVLFFPRCPFPLPEGPDREFLLQQQIRRLTAKHITYDPARDTVAGFRRTSTEQAQRLRGLLASFSESVTAWLTATLPHYQGGLQRDRASYRSEEEATRRLRHSARNDLLHIDSFPNRPSLGRRILRIWSNIHPSEPRVWVTSDLLSRVLERYGRALGVSLREKQSWLTLLRQGLLGLLMPGRPQRSAYDSFMVRLHNALKLNDEFQERSPKRLWIFPPGSAWMLFTDARTHAELRGRFALEHSFFVDPRALVCPEHSPVTLVDGPPLLPPRRRAA